MNAREEITEMVAAVLAGLEPCRHEDHDGTCHHCAAEQVMELFPNVGTWYWDPKGRWWGEPQDHSFQVTFTARTGLYPLPSRSPSTESEKS